MTEFDENVVDGEEEIEYIEELDEVDCDSEDQGGEVDYVADDEEGEIV